jgi:predicted DNA-binding WGR domain protein
MITTATSYLNRPYHARWERGARFYELRILVDLIGHTVAMRSWGISGELGVGEIRNVLAWDEACTKLILRVSRQLHKRRYVPVYNGGIA